MFHPKCDFARGENRINHAIWGLKLLEVTDVIRRPDSAEHDSFQDGKCLSKLVGGVIQQRTRRFKRPGRRRQEIILGLQEFVSKSRIECEQEIDPLIDDANDFSSLLTHE